MRILFIAQTVDLDNPVLGFFHRWIEVFIKQAESAQVICLQRGRVALPSTVPVFSLGKEMKQSRLMYVVRFYRRLWSIRNEYDTVFVHMNQEYILLAGLLWMLQGKKVYLWRNHYQSNALMSITAFFCTKMFCTSKFSYITKYKKTVLMSLGIDTDSFKPMPGVAHENSVLFLARIAPSKRVEVLIEALGILSKKGITVRADIFGDATVSDADYKESLIRQVKTLGLESLVHFFPGVPNTETPKIYSAHEIFVNCSRSGMYDKTIFEAAACGVLSVASSQDYAELVGTQLSFDGTAESLASTLENLALLSEVEKKKLQEQMSQIAEQNSLTALASKLFVEMQSA